MTVRYTDAGFKSFSGEVCKYNYYLCYTLHDEFVENSVGLPSLLPSYHRYSLGGYSDSTLILAPTYEFDKKDSSTIVDFNIYLDHKKYIRFYVCTGRSANQKKAQIVGEFSEAISKQIFDNAQSIYVDENELSRLTFSNTGKDFCIFADMTPTTGGRCYCRQLNVSLTGNLHNATEEYISVDRHLQSLRCYMEHFACVVQSQTKEMSDMRRQLYDTNEKLIHQTKEMNDMKDKLFDMNQKLQLLAEPVANPEDYFIQIPQPETLENDIESYSVSTEDTDEFGYINDYDICQ